MKTAQIIPVQNIPPHQNQIYSYSIPKNLDEKIKIGQEVRMLLRNKMAKGVVFDVENELAKKGSGAKKTFPYKLKEVSEIVGEEPTLTKNQLRLAKWMADYYYVSLGLVCKFFLPKRIKRIGKFKKAEYQTRFSPFPKLTRDQETAYQTIKNSKNGSIFLLHGVTGSGKTEIYLASALDFLKKGKQIAYLVPEIALTPQTIARLLSRFPKEKNVVIHSRLSATERYLAWKDIRENRAKIIIGPRSIVFAPYQDLGLLIVDEEHDSSYKSYDQAPRYLARDVVIKLANLHSAKVILGSATPSIESYYLAKQGRYTLIELPHRFFGKGKMPKIEIVDMREESKKKNFSLFSDKLQKKMAEVTKQKRQTILFLGRRGTSTFIICHDCGLVLKCKKCEAPLVAHSLPKFGKKIIYQQNLLCHHCGGKENLPLLCSRCGSHQLKFYGAGTEKVEMEVKSLLPKARVRRLDTDAMNKKFVHQKTYFDFLNQKYDILVGTQMITKGWDIPRVDLIGIVLADTVLNLPDFRSAEKTFQLILQVSGRSGRKDSQGKVILQTYMPENPILQAAKNHDFRAFYDYEIRQREELSFPPFSQLIKISFRHKNPKKAREKIFHLSKNLHSLISNLQSQTSNFQHLVSMIGPAPAFIPRIRGFYSWHLVLKSKIFEVKLRNEILAKSVSAGFSVDVDPESLL